MLRYKDADLFSLKVEFGIGLSAAVNAFIGVGWNGYPKSVYALSLNVASLFIAITDPDKT